MRFHLEGEAAALYEQVLGGPFHFRVDEANEMDWGMQVKCLVLNGKFEGKTVFHSISNEPTEGSMPYIIQFLDALGLDSSGDVDLQEEDFVDCEFVAKARKQKNNPEFSQLFNFQSVDEADAAALRP